jgi:hypothetical protein
MSAGIRWAWIWLCAALLGLLHQGPSLCKAASRLSLIWLGIGGEWLGGGGAHDSTPHDSTQGQAEQRSTVHQLPFSSTYEHNFTSFRVELDLLDPILVCQTHYYLLSADSLAPLLLVTWLGSWFLNTRYCLCLLTPGKSSTFHSLTSCWP